MTVKTPCHLLLVATLFGWFPAGLVSAAEAHVRVLIVDGVNNHDWRTTTDSILATLQATNVFAVDVSSAPQPKMYPSAREPKDDATKSEYREFVQQYQNPQRKLMESSFAEIWEAWKPEFERYDTVLINYNGRAWPKSVQAAFEKYVRDGGGVVLVHASSNAFRDWDAFNQIIGLGYNGNRGTTDGACTKVRPKTGDTFTCCEGQNSGHGSRHPFVLQVREPKHPVMVGLPAAWRHGRDELYHNLRGPARNMVVLSSAYSDPSQRGSGDHEPITMAIKYGKGRVIHTTMGHFWRGQTDYDALHCVGFQTLIARACQYTATGKVTLDVPKEFPADGETSIMPPHKVTWTVDGMPTSIKPFDKTDWQQKLADNPYQMLSQMSN